MNLFTCIVSPYGRHQRAFDWMHGHTRITFSDLRQEELIYVKIMHVSKILRTLDTYVLMQGVFKEF